MREPGYCRGDGRAFVPPGPRSLSAVRVLRISVTDVCNLRCIYCMPADGVRWLPKDEILTYEEIVEVVGAAIDCGIREYKLTGGEPLARRDLAWLVQRLGRLKGRGIEDLSLTTNGILLAGVAHRLRELGLDRLTISLDTLDGEKFRRITGGGEIKRVWEGMEAAQAAGFPPPKINVVVMRGINEEDVVDFARLTVERPVTVRFIEFMPLGRSALDQEAGRVAMEEIVCRLGPLGRLEPADPDAGSGPAKLFRLPGAKGKIGLIAAMSRPFCNTCNRLRLTADGRLRSCLFERGEVDLRGMLRPAVDKQGLRDGFIRCVEMKPAEHGPRGQGQMSRIGG